MSDLTGLYNGSPVSDDGRGLKLVTAQWVGDRADGSPVSDDGRGLKLQCKSLTTTRSGWFARQ